MTIYNLGFVKELVNAFNISNYGSKVNTNFVVEGDNIVVKFNCDKGSAEKYLSQMARDLVREYYSDESVARHAFDLGSLPFNFDKGKWTYSGAVTKLTVPIDNGVIFNLKVHFAEGFEIGVKNQMIKAIDEKHHLGKKRIEEILNASIKQAKMDPSSSYIKCLLFYDTNVQKYFVKALQAQMNEYGYNYLDFYDIDYEDKKIYFKDVENIGFIRSVTEISKKKTVYNFNLQGVGNLKVKAERYKGAMGELIFRLAGVSICGYYRDNFISKDRISKGDNFAFIPMIEEDNISRYLNRGEANKINAQFGYDLLTDIKGQTETTRSGRFGGVYAFSDRQIALLIPVIIENSVINKDGQIEIDPGLRFRALSPAQSPLNSPTHAGPSGLRTPPNKRKADTDSGYDSNSPPKPKDSVAPSTSGDPRSLVEQPQAQVRSPTERSQDVTLKESPRQGLVGKIPEFPVLRENPLDVPGTSGVSGPSSSSQSLSAAQNVPAAWTQNPWSSPPPAHENKWTSSLPFTKQGPSGLSWTQSSSRPLSSLPPPPPLIPISGSVSGSQPPTPSGTSSWKGAQAGANISKEEEKLIKALLYTLNLTNYTSDGVYTNFFAKDGKIVSLLHDTVDREEYLQEVRDYIIEEYCEDEEEARELYDLDEFPFKLNYEEKQGKTVVANISSGALSNLKILFSQKFGKNVDAIDISAVKKVKKREKDEWVDRQRFYGASLQDACESCFPDEGPMKEIPIALEGDEYVLDRSLDIREVELLFKEQLRRLRDTSVAGKGESDDKPLTEEEKELFKALLYAFNYSNHNLDCPDTNFTVKNGKITSLIDDSVNVKEYLQKVRDKTEKKYYKDKKEDYDFTDFPFEFLSNCEKNQKTTVVANISRGALLNLKKLFIYGYKKGDINTKVVEEAVKSKKDELVDFKLKGGEREGGYPSRITPDEAVKESYPDKNALGGIPITKDKGGYCLKRDYEPGETQEYAQGRPKAKRKKEKMKPDNKDSGISSGEATDAENVSSKAEGKTSSGYESMDCENTGGGLPKRKSPEPLAGSSATKKTRSKSDSSSFEGGVGSPHPGLSGPTLEQVREQLSKTGISKW